MFDSLYLHGQICRRSTNRIEKQFVCSFVRRHETECLVSTQPPSMCHMLLILDVSPCCPPLSARYQGGEGCHEYPASPCHPVCHQWKVNVTSVSKRVTYISLSGLIDQSRQHHMLASSELHIFSCSNLVHAGKASRFNWTFFRFVFLLWIPNMFLFPSTVWTHES